MAELIFIAGPEQGRTVTLEGDEAVIGRGANCTVPITDRQASRRHCRIALSDGHYSVHDLQSTNGTFLNDAPLQRAALRDGDVITIGDSRIRFLLTAGAPESTLVRGAAHPVAEADPLVGRSIGRYQIERRLRRSKTAVLYRAQDTRDGGFVVLKLLPPTLAGRDEIVKRFIREAKTGAEWKHANVVQTLGAGRKGELYFIVSEYVGGWSLQELLDEQGERGRFDTARTLDIMIAIGRALEFARQHDIVHRDIKPANIIIGEDGVARLDNLWLAKHIHSQGSDLTAAEMPLGTLGYMAPEQLADARSVDCRADIYSLAATIYRALTGVVPCRGATAIETMRKIRDEAPAPVQSLNPAVPPAVARPVERALAKDPDQRQQTPAELLVELRLARKYQVRGPDDRRSPR